MTDKKIKIATAWLEGCSGCHMSLLDMDESIIDLAHKINLVYSPLVDFKNDQIPDNIDVVLIEGAVGNDHDLKLAKTLRAKAKLLVAVGDCAVTGNLPSMRNSFKTEEILEQIYINQTDHNPQIPCENIPQLNSEVTPLHFVVDVDLFVHGCPPPSSNIQFVLNELLEGRMPNLEGKQKFG